MPYPRLEFGPEHLRVELNSFPRSAHLERAALLTLGSRRSRIGILCLSAIADDPRVRRQGDLFAAAGWEVVAIGLSGARSSSPNWACFAIEDNATARPRPGLSLSLPAKYGWSVPPDLARRGTQLSRGISRLAEIARLIHDHTYADTIYWRMNPVFDRVYRLARLQQVDLWVANDWTTLPIARLLSAEQGVPYGYDTHELAVDEHAQNWLWRIGQRPIIAAIESAGIRAASFVTCVSDGIADRLTEIHGLETRPTVIRNMPMYSPQAFHPCGQTVKVLYHGAVFAGRGLEACIRSVALWRREFHLTIRGPSTPGYLQQLMAECLAAGVEERVTFDEPVPMTEMVARANGFDVGLFALPDHSLQNLYVLPNKFFEYTMAGLALCVSDLPEMTRLLRQYDLGTLIPAVTPEAIAAAINSLDRAGIDRFKHNALAAARELNWQAEGGELVALCAQSLGARRTSG